jgi:hypothetical protein
LEEVVKESWMQCEKELVRSFLGEWILIVLLRPKGDFYLEGGSI